MSNLAVLTAVVLLLHAFLDGQFLSFGPEFIRYYLALGDDLSNPAVRFQDLSLVIMYLKTLYSLYNFINKYKILRLFPVLVRCVVKRFGPSGKHKVT